MFKRFKKFKSFTISGKQRSTKIIIESILCASSDAIACFYVCRLWPTVSAVKESLKSI